MRRRLPRKISDLTPLLDVVLILLFALLIPLQQENETQEEQVQSLSEQVSDLEEDNQSLSQINASLEAIDEQRKEDLEAIFKDSSLEEFVDENDLENTDDIDLLVHQLSYLVNQYYFINVRVDSNHGQMVYINDTPTYVYLTDSLRTDEDGIESAKDTLEQALENEITEKQGGTERVLLTLEDDGNMYHYGFELLWEIFGEIQSTYGNKTIYRIQYLQY